MPRPKQIFLKALHEAARFGPEDIRVAATLNKLGLVYHEENKLAEAEAAFRRCLPIFEVTYGVDSIDVANVNYDIGSVLIDLGKHADALPFSEGAKHLMKGLRYKQREDRSCPLYDRRFSSRAQAVDRC